MGPSAIIGSGHTAEPAALWGCDGEDAIVAGAVIGGADER